MAGPFPIRSDLAPPVRLPATSFSADGCRWRTAVGQYYGYVNQIGRWDGELQRPAPSVQRRAARGVTVSANYLVALHYRPGRRRAANTGSANGGTPIRTTSFDRGNCAGSALISDTFNLSGSRKHRTFQPASRYRIRLALSPIFRILSGLAIRERGSDLAFSIANQRANSSGRLWQRRRITGSIPEHSRGLQQVPLET
jgi:hypothetical protein